MSIEVVCKCGGRFRAPDDAAGKSAKCPKCGAQLVIPHSTAGTATSVKPVLPPYPKPGFVRKNWSWALVGCGSLVLGLVIGYFAGREHLKYEIRRGIESAFEGLADSLGLPGDDDPGNLAARHEGQEPDTADARGTGLSVLPDTRLAVQYAKVYFSGSDFMSRPAIELNVRNESPSPISRAHFHAVVRSPGRTIPWLEDDFSYEIPGGLEPGEAAQWRLSPNMFSAWGKLPAERTDLQLDVTVVRIDGPTGQQLFTWQAAEQQAP